MQLPQMSPEHATNFFLAKLAFTTGPVELDRMIRDQEQVTIIDVRSADDFAKSRIPGAINMPEEHWEHADQLDKEKLNVIYCYSAVCHLAAKAAVELATQGFRVMEMEGGMEAWRAQGLDVEGAQRGAAEKTEKSAKASSSGKKSSAKLKAVPAVRDTDDDDIDLEDSLDDDETPSLGVSDEHSGDEADGDDDEDEEREATKEEDVPMTRRGMKSTPPAKTKAAVPAKAAKPAGKSIVHLSDKQRLAAAKSKTAAKPQVANGTKPAPKAVAKPQPKAAAKPAGKTAAKPAAKTAAKGKTPLKAKAKSGSARKA